MRRTIKAGIICLAAVLVAPLVVVSWVEKLLRLGESAFVTFAHGVALVPGPIGHWIRAAYYVGTLDRCSWETHIGFGSFFTHRGADISPNVSTGAYCVLGHAVIGPGVRIASRVSIPSGKRQHVDEDGKLIEGANFERVRIGAGCWIGEGAIVVADVGQFSIVSAAAVVINPVPDRCIVGGNPARILKQMERPSAASVR